MDFIDRLPEEPGRSEEETMTLKRIAEGGAAKIKEYVESENNAWKDIPLNIGVTGLSGVGKSSFINVLRGLKKGQKGYARVGVTEATHVITPYPHPDNPSLIFWDMPGVGTPSFPKETYLTKVNFDKYDFFLILSQKRFRDEDAWLAEKAVEMGKSWFFVRTHIHQDVTNDKEEDPENHSREKLLEVIREDCTKHLTAAKVKSVEVFLIDNRRPLDYDFEILTTRLMDCGLSDETKRNALILSLSVMTKAVIKEKKNLLEKRIWKVALASAAAGAIPIPGIGALVDVPLMVAELMEYRRQFGLTDERLQIKASQSEFVLGLIKKYGIYCAELALVLAADEALESAVKIGIPLIGSVISGVLSYNFTVAALRKLLNEVANDAERLCEETVKELLP